MTDVQYEAADGIASIVLNRPEVRNALTDRMFADIVASVHRAEADDDVRVIVLRGEGKSFCSGFDVSDPDAFYGEGRNGHRFAIHKLKARAEVMRDLLYSMKPIIASLHGHCIGAGFYLTLVSDFAIAAEGTVFGLPEERFGASGTSWLYPFVASQCGVKWANEILMTGRRLEADEVARLNLINRVVPAEQLEHEVDELARAIRSLPRDGIAVSRTVAHMTYAMLGIAESFVPHYGAHPMIVDMTREPDEFDFHGTVAERGLKEALAARNKVYEGSFWGW